MLEADQAMAQAVKLDASDAGLLRDMGSLYAAVGKVRAQSRVPADATHACAYVHTWQSAP